MNVKRLFIKKSVFLVFILLSFIPSCRLNVPIREMTLAKSSITRALEVKADTYASEELKKAKEHLLASHEFIMSDNIDRAREEADRSLECADDAIERSLPLLASDFLYEAKKVYDEAANAYAEKYSPEEFGLAGENIEEAEGMLGDGEFWDSYLRSKRAIRYATEARDKALANIPALKDEITRIKEETKKLEANRGGEFASEEIDTINSKLEDASSDIEKNNIKESSLRISEADTALKSAILKTQRGLAAEGIKIASEALKKVEGSDLKELFLEDIEKATKLIDGSKDLFEREAYEESNLKSKEAIELLNSISIAMEKKVEEIRIEEERRRIEAAKEVDKEEKIEGDVIQKEYIVKLNPNKRDCLWRIAYYTYKDARLWPLIYMANRDKIKDPDLIFPGQRFIIPPIPKRKDDTEQKKKEETATGIENQTEIESAAEEERVEGIVDQETSVLRDTTESSDREKKKVGE